MVEQNFAHLEEPELALDDNLSGGASLNASMRRRTDTRSAYKSTGEGAAYLTLDFNCDLTTKADGDQQIETFNLDNPPAAAAAANDMVFSFLTPEDEEEDWKK